MLRAVEYIQNLLDTPQLAPFPAWFSGESPPLLSFRPIFAGIKGHDDGHLRTPAFIQVDPTEQSTSVPVKQPFCPIKFYNLPHPKRKTKGKCRQ
jgi:hypothetical protein